MDFFQYKMTSPLGPIYLVASPVGLQGVYFNKQQVSYVNALGKSTVQERILNKAVKQLGEYFAGRRKRFELVLDLAGTPFQQQVWRQLLKIPFGKTVAYNGIAKKIKRPKAVRAVGSANGKNPLCIIIPCHRVIAADGSIGGYSGGIGIKKRLLELEGIKS